MFPRCGWLPMVVCALVLVGPAPAQYTWTGAGGGSPFFDPVNWSTPTNWSGNALPPSGTGTAITFASAPSGLSNENLGPFTVNSLTFNTSITVTGSALTMAGSAGIFPATGTTVTITNDLTIPANGRLNVGGNSATVNLSGAITGGGELQIGFNSGLDASLFVHLGSGSNSFAGGTKIYSVGTVLLDPGANLPAGLDVKVHTGTLDLNNNNVTIGNLILTDPTLSAAPGPARVLTEAGTLTVNGSILYAPNGAAHAPTATISGHLAFGGVNHEIDILPGGDLTDTIITADISGTAGFTKTGNGSLVLTQPISNTGPVTLNSGNIGLGAANVLSRAVVINGGSLSLGAFPQAFGSLAGADNTTVTFGPVTLTVGTDNTDTTYGGDLFSNGGTFLKVGTGTLRLNPSSSVNLSGTIKIVGGTLAVTSDNAFGGAGLTLDHTLTVQPAGRLLMTATTTSTGRTFDLAGGTLEAAAGATITLSDSAINGGYMRGAGKFAVAGGTALNGVTTFGNLTINQTGAGSFVNFTNGGALTVSAGPANPSTLSGFTNQGSGSITIGAGSKVNAAEFQTYGVMTLTPAAAGSGPATLLTNTGSSPLYFNGGSRTFIGTPPTAGQNLALVDMHGQNAIVAGGLFVNNGFVGDSTNSGATVIADYGALVKGAGIYANPVITQNGGKFQAGNSPGKATFGSLTLGPGGTQNFNWQINNATGVAGPSPNQFNQVSGWSLLSSEKVIDPFTGLLTSGDLNWTATSTPGNQFNLSIQTLVNPTTVGQDVQGQMANFDSLQPHSWKFATWQGSYTGPADDATLNSSVLFDTTNFSNSYPPPLVFILHYNAAAKEIDIVYTIPEPGTLALTGLAGLLWAARSCSRNRRRVQQG